MENIMNEKIHILANGARIISLSPHGFKFSDGTASEAQTPKLVSFFTLERVTEEVSRIKGMRVQRTSMPISEEQLAHLGHLVELADLILVPFPVLVALREQGIRDNYPSVVAFNATLETQRSAPAEKIVDIDNWSY